VSAVTEVAKGSRTGLAGTAYRVGVTTTAGPDLIDVAAVLLGADGRVRTDDDFVFFNNPRGPGVRLLPDGSVEVDLAAVPADVARVVVTGSTEAQGRTFRDATDLRVRVQSDADAFGFAPDGLSTETVLQVVALYRRGAGWRLEAVGQGYDRGLAAFATEHGIDVEPEAAEPGAVEREVVEPVVLQKVAVTLTKGSPHRTATIDLRKGDPSWVLTVGLEWDGRGAVYDPDGRVTSYGEGDLDVYFFCRDERTGDYVVVSGERGHQGGLGVWPFVHHCGDSRGPGHDGAPAVEQVRVRPDENGDLLVNVYQSVDNGEGAIDDFGRPRVAIRHGRPGPDGLPGPDADEVVVHVGNGEESYWATVARIDVRDGVLTVDGETRYSDPDSELMPVLDREGNWVAEARDAPEGRSKEEFGTGLDRYRGHCPDPARR
jgi:tellurite resistance protein TerA